MKIQCFIFAVSFGLIVGRLFGQTNQAGRLFIPYLDKESQSNVIVSICDFGHGKNCPPQYTNILSNTNLFTSGEQKLIGEVFIKYRNVTTNFGPTGTILKELYRTNYIVQVMGRTIRVEDWIANFQYTNLNAKEEIRFGSGGIIVKFRNESNNGYNAYFTRAGDGTLLTFEEIQKDINNGLFVRFDDNYPQGTTWNIKLTRFTGEHIEEYRHSTNKLVMGKYLMWNPINGNLMLEANFKEPYDLGKHRIDLKALKRI